MLSLNARLGACTLALAAPLAVGAEDQEGSADPPGLVRFPDSWIVAYEPPTPMRGYEFVTGRVDRSQRDRRIDSAQRIAGRLVRVTYRLPTGTRYEDVIGHYQSLVADQDGEVVFTCRGRDCGRSTVWANDVFGVKELVAPGLRAVLSGRRHRQAAGRDLRRAARQPARVRPLGGCSNGGCRGAGRRWFAGPQRVCGPSRCNSGQRRHPRELGKWRRWQRSRSNSARSRVVLCMWSATCRVLRKQHSPGRSAVQNRQRQRCVMAAWMLYRLLPGRCCRVRVCRPRALNWLRHQRPVDRRGFDRGVRGAFGERRCRLRPRHQQRD